MSKYNDESNLILKPLKAFGQIQRQGFFTVTIPIIPFQGPAQEIEFLIRTTSIPEEKRETTLVRTLIGDLMHPDRSVPPHDWKVTAFLAEADTMFHRLLGWYRLLDVNPLASMKTTAYIDLISLDVPRVNRQFTLFGVFPKNIPGVEQLQYDEPSGMVKMTVNFSIDGIQYVGG